MLIYDWLCLVHWCFILIFSYLKNRRMSNTAKILAALAAGAVAGAAIGILFAPDKGSETRKKVSEEGKKLAQSLKEKFNSVKERSEQMAGDIQKSIDDLEGRTNEMREKMNQYTNS